MSVALPKTSVVFGSVTPVQGDIIDLQVHLGCSTEISSFDCLLQNFDKKYSPGGTYPINVGDNASISLGRDPNCPSVLTGKVEEIEPFSDAVEHYVRVKGRCNGEQLFRCLVTKTWDNTKGEVIVKYLIDNYTSLSHVRSSVELVEDTDTTYTFLEYEDTPVFDIIKYIAETADKTGVIGFDFRIASDGKFEFFAKNSKTSSVNLSERLEVSEYKKEIHRIKNKITIRGFAGKVEPSNIDAWTESLDNWSADSGYGTMLLEDWLPKWGTYSVKCSRIGETSGTVMFKRIFSQVAKPQILRMWLGASNNYWNNADSWVRLLAPDESNYFELPFADLPVEPPLIGSWGLEEIALGKENTFNAQTNPNGKWVKVGSPSWANIQGIKFRRTATSGLGQVGLLVDGLHFDKVRYNATREDAPSQSQYGLREKVETDEELRSDAECDYRAKALLDFLKGPIETLKVRSEVIDYGTTPILAADKIHIVIPNENIDANYRVISAEYKASGREQTLDIELELGREPQLLADFIYGFRKSIQKLDKYKPSDIQATSISGGGGGGGMSQHGNEYHDPDFEEYGKIKGKTVDDSAIGNDKILVYKNASQTLVYEAKPSSGGSVEDIIFGALFETFSGLDIYTVGGDAGYSVTKHSWGATLETTATANKKAYAQYDISGFDWTNFFNAKSQFECLIWLDTISQLDVYIVVGGLTDPTTPQKKYGVRITAGALKIVTSDGTTQSESTSLMTLSTATMYRLKVKFTAGSQVEVWIDGVSKGTKTTNLPTGDMAAGCSLPLFWAKTTASVANNLIFAALRVMRNY